jgi:hypothetical protein
MSIRRSSAARRIGRSVAAADRQRHQVALAQRSPVLGLQADGLVAAHDLAIAVAAGHAAEQALGHTAEAVAVERDLHVVLQDLESAQEASPPRIVIVEQQIDSALAVADRAVIMERREIRLTATSGCAIYLGLDDADE